jgi:cysteine desulfurase
MGAAAKLAQLWLTSDDNPLSQKPTELVPWVPPKKLRSMRDRLEHSILTTLDQTQINGDPAHRLPNTTNIGFERLEAEAILLLLSEQDICASAGAACSSGSLEPSHVLQAMNINPKFAHGAIRFSLSRYTTDREIDQTLQLLPTAIARLRAVLPVG